MEIFFINKRLEKILNSEDLLIKEYGVRRAEIIKNRMALLSAATNLNEVPHTPPVRRHKLKGDKKEHFVVDALYPYRIEFIPYHSNQAMQSHKLNDLRTITSIKILYIRDYHK